MKDLYKILEISADASTKQIKKAYHKLAIQYHPDKNAGDKEAEAKFKEASEAYSVLGDPQKRARYDQFGDTHNPGVGGFEDVFSHFSDIFGGFGDFFGHSHNRRSSKKGANHVMEIEIEFKDAFFGCDKKITIPRSVSCDLCHGSGCRLGSEPVTCVTCGGRGLVVEQQLFMTLKTTCPACHGNGNTIKDPCDSCRGSGTMQMNDAMTIAIPAGVDSGDKLRVPHKGFAGKMGGPPGDLFLVINAKSSSEFRREGFDLHSVVTVPVTSAILGGKINAPTMYGNETITIGPGTQSESVILLEKKGVPQVNALGCGDHYIHLKINIPQNLTSKQKDLVLQLHEDLD